MQEYLSTGSPVYFVVEAGHNYTTLEGQNLVCGGSGCPENSLLGQVYQATRQPNRFSVMAFYFFGVFAGYTCDNVVLVSSVRDSGFLS